ncbi:hypothetical protein ACSBL2_09590 [Pedobacter sp. AW31-3R]
MKNTILKRILIFTLIAVVALSSFKKKTAGAGDHSQVKMVWAMRLDVM